MFLFLTFLFCGAPRANRQRKAIKRKLDLFPSVCPTFLAIIFLLPISWRLASWRSRCRPSFSCLVSSCKATCVDSHITGKQAVSICLTCPKLLPTLSHKRKQRPNLSQHLSTESDTVRPLSPLWSLISLRFFASSAIGSSLSLSTIVLCRI